MLLNELTFKDYLSLITEDTSSDLIDAINNRNVCIITYTKNGATSERVIEPVSLGYAFGKGLYLRAWQRSGNSESFDSGRWKKKDPLTKIAGYRMFNLDYINTIKVTKEVFRTDKTFLRANRPKHNRYFNRHDKDMTRIVAAVMLDNNIGIEFIFNELIDKLLKNPKISMDDKNIIDTLEASDFKKTLPNVRNVEIMPRNTKEKYMMAYIAGKLGKKVKKMTI